MTKHANCSNKLFALVLDWPKNAVIFIIDNSMTVAPDEMGLIFYIYLFLLNLFFGHMAHGVIVA